MSYNQNYHLEIQKTASRSAEGVINLLRKLFNPKSVVDVGCGRGAWLAEWERQGVSEILGVDGGGQDIQSVLISPEKYIEHNLEKELQLDRKFDIATCFEVVEHLSKSSAETIVNTLVSLSDIIVFSAAVPRQGGYKHINEQWPAYWCEKFKEKGYVFVDGIRWHIMPDSEISWWYRQNTFLVMKREIYLEKYSYLPEYSSEFYVMHKNVYNNFSKTSAYLLFLTEQFVYNNFHQLYHYLTPFAKKYLKR